MIMNEKKIVIYTDGGARNNPGPAALGAVIRWGGKEEKIKKYLGEMTNNEAEYLAAIEALKEAKKFVGKKTAKGSVVELFSDSQLMVKQINHEYKVKEERMQKLFVEAWNLMLDFKEVKVSHVRREKNKGADALVNEALDEQSSKFNF